MPHQQPYYGLVGRVRASETVSIGSARGREGTAVCSGGGIRPRATPLRQRGRGVIGHRDTDHGGTCGMSENGRWLVMFRDLVVRRSMHCLVFLYFFSAMTNRKASHVMFVFSWIYSAILCGRGPAEDVLILDLRGEATARLRCTLGDVSCRDIEYT